MDRTSVRGSEEMYYGQPVSKAEDASRRMNAISMECMNKSECERELGLYLLTKVKHRLPESRVAMRVSKDFGVAIGKGKRANFR